MHHAVAIASQVIEGRTKLMEKRGSSTGGCETELSFSQNLGVEMSVISNRYVPEATDLALRLGFGEGLGTGQGAMVPPPVERRL